ncbi:MAG: NAD(+) diphosphatase [Desulfuromonadaceae bacterium]|nr:NAD(+) diphosphatase [Desulfuromonadaceae bacterium]
MLFDQAYEDALFLPFNRASLDGNFEQATSPADPGGEGYWLVLQGTHFFLEPRASLPQRVPVPDSALCLYLGRWRGKPCRVCRWPKDVPLPQGLVGYSLQEEVPTPPLALNSLAALARQVLHWHDSSRFCSRCGGVLTDQTRGWGRHCPACRRESYPHIHPCAIVLVARGDEILLTRKASWKPGRYSLVAGFVDVGECLEETAVREVREETGIEVKNIRYMGSQAWPFPSQIMAGFFADYAAGEVRVEEAELEDAGWFHIDRLPLLPSRRSISRFLVDQHLILRGRSPGGLHEPAA